MKFRETSVPGDDKPCGCHTLYSEDLGHGQDYEGVRFVNPFLGGQ